MTDYKSMTTEELLSKRSFYIKEASRLDNIQMAIKIALNSAYGALGNMYFRYFDVRLAESITTSGKLSIIWIQNKVNEYLNDINGTNNVDYVIASDTDSLYLNLDPVVQKYLSNLTEKEKIVSAIDKFCETKLAPYINKSYDELCDKMCAYKQKMKMKRENIVDVAIWTAKKRYILSIYNSEGVQYTQPKIKISGLEMVKSSHPSSVRKKLKDAVSIIIKTESQDKLQKFIEEYEKDFLGLDVKTIAFPRGVNGMRQYSGSPIYTKGTPIHVRASLLYNFYLQKFNLDKKYPLIKDGDKIKFFYLKLPNPIHEDVFGFVGEFPKEFDEMLGKYIDYERMFESVFMSPLDIVLKPIGWNGRPKTSLEDFF